MLYDLTKTLRKHSPEAIWICHVPVSSSDTAGPSQCFSRAMTLKPVLMLCTHPTKKSYFNFFHRFDIYAQLQVIFLGR